MDSILHSQAPPIVHLDFTPDNLLLKNKDSSLVLIDFNIAEQLENRVTKTVAGKQCYIPPEQFQGQPVPVSDIYACGATLYWLLTGEDPAPLTQSQISSIRSDVSPHLDAIVMRATSQDASDRFNSAAEMKEALLNLPNRN